MKYYKATFNNGKQLTFWAVSLDAAFSYANKFGWATFVGEAPLPGYRLY
jgi:hypothetical protein